MSISSAFHIPYPHGCVCLCVWCACPSMCFCLCLCCAWIFNVAQGHFQLKYVYVTGRLNANIFKRRREKILTEKLPLRCSARTSATMVWLHLYFLFIWFFYTYLLGCTSYFVSIVQFENEKSNGTAFLFARIIFGSLYASYIINHVILWFVAYLHQRFN